jgi:undecaprenyl-diphosphatase
VLLHLVRTVRRSGAFRHVTEFTFLGALLGIAAAGWFFIEIADGVREKESEAIDRSILLWLRSSEQPRWLLELARDVTALGSTAVLTLFVAATAAFLALSRRGRACVFVLAAAISSRTISM